MGRNRLVLIAALLFALLVGSTPARGQTVTFTATFAGLTPGVQQQPPAGWDVQLHQRDAALWADGRPMTAAHGPMCEPPPATHATTGWDGAVFVCGGPGNEHLMTAVNAPGYGMISLTPPALVDFRTGPATVSWRMSTHREDRDWVAVTITPEADYLSRPLLANNPTVSQPNGSNVYPDLHGHARSGVLVKMSEAGGNTVFTANRIQNYVRSAIPGNTGLYYENFLTPDAARRDLFVITISRTSLSVCMPEYHTSTGAPRCWVNATVPDLGFDVAAVSFEHHSYNPCKDTTHIPCPNTWHWDDFQISPAVARTIVPVTPHLAGARPDNETVDFALPAGGGTLRWAGVTKADAAGQPVMDVSFDGGASWQPATLQRGSRQQTGSGDPELASSFLCDVPETATRVRWRYDYGTVQDVHLWRQE